MWGSNPSLKKLQLLSSLRTLVATQGVRVMLSLGPSLSYLLQSETSLSTRYVGGEFRILLRHHL